MQIEELVTISIGMGSSESELFKPVRDKSIVAHSHHSNFTKDFTRRNYKMNRYFNENEKRKISNT